MKNQNINISTEEKERILEMYNISKNMNSLNEQPESVMDRRLGINQNIEKALQSISNAERKYNCVPKKFTSPVNVLIKKGYNKNILKLALSIIGRESSFSSGTRYSILEPAKEFASFLGINTSVGPAQMSSETAEELGLNLSYITTYLGALDGAYQKLLRSINIAKSKGYTVQSSNLGNEGTGMAIYDIAIAAYNTGDSIITKWCESNVPERIREGLKNKCDSSEANKTKEVKNYVPNYKTERWDGVEITTHGYVKETAGYFKDFNCF